jgi:lipid-A-disaccharide synthase-like uncharacterized protein
VTILDLLGYTGSALFSIAYYFNSRESNLDMSYKFQILNAVAGSISIIYSYCHGAHASVFTNVIWVLITLKSLSPSVEKKLRKSFFKS